MASAKPTELEKTNLEVHVDLCSIRYEQLEGRLSKVEAKIDKIHEDVKEGNSSLIKVIVGAAATIVASLLSTVVVLLLKL